MGTKAHRNKKGERNVSDDIELDDERFQAARVRPQFARPREQSSKVVLDDRFASVLTDPRFQMQQKDKYGRKTKEIVANELSVFYTVERDEEHDSERDHQCDDEPPNMSSSDEAADHHEPEDPASRIAYLTALSRGELSVSSSADENSDSESSGSDFENESEDPVYGAAGILDPSHRQQRDQVSLTNEATRFMAITNMDWGSVRAVDLFAILSSFSPPGSLRRVQVYPSDFGKERMAQDTLYGPKNLWKKEKHSQRKFKGNSDQPGSSDDQSSDTDSESGEGSRKAKLKIEYPNEESDFDMEKLRAYEAAKLRYYFAVIEFASPVHADLAYREVDGLEFEHSSAALDMRAIVQDDLEGIRHNRQLRDEAICIPGNYEPPEFIVNALQQTSVQCTWEDGDAERERKLTGYGRVDPAHWSAVSEADDLKAYLASDLSSYGSEEDSDSDCLRHGKGGKMRQLLGLDSDDEMDNETHGSDESSSCIEDDKEEPEIYEKISKGDDEANSKEVTFVPGKGGLEAKIRSKLEAKKEASDDLTPWEKYQLKRKEKRRERRQARRNRRDIVAMPPEDKEEVDGMHESDQDFDNHNDDNFFLHDGIPREGGKHGTTNGDKPSVELASERTPSTKEELELLLAGDDDEEGIKDYDMRGLRRIDKNKGKKLRGARKRKEAKLAANVSGADFRVDTRDERFAAMMDGADDRFGIDPTDPSFKQTSAMRQILAEQTKRRKATKRAKRSSKDEIAPDISADATGASSGGAAALSSLVMSLKSKVAKRVQ